MAAADTEDRPPVDIFVIGGGVNGCGIARDAAGRGFSVMLAEMGDLASGTSSAATKLVHGGLRYLEYYEFRLVREALTEREVLWAAAPHIVKPLRFVLPYHAGLRPAFVLRSGLFLYDHLGGRKLLPPTRTVDLTRDEAGKPLKPGYRTGFEYSDCWVNDARLVVLCARDAADHGATILTRTRVTSARRADGLWAIELTDVETGDRSTVRAKFLVNAAGPWVDHVIVEALGQNGAHNVRLVKGSHIVVKKHYAHDRCYIFQNADNRIIFAIPYEGEFTLIGTTDVDYQDDPAKVAISDAEIDYLCAAASEYFREPVTRDAIVWSYSGVRPLFDDHASAAQEATRDYVLRLDHPAGAPGLLDVFGGKLTTHRRLAEDAMEKIETVIGRRGRPWTRGAKLPGGDFAPTDFSGEVARTAARHLDLPRELIERLVRLYGTKTAVLLDGVETLADLGEDFGAGLSAREVDYLVAHEWARTAEDILWRRTKLGLHGADRGKLEKYLQKKAVGGS
jgi:glycerol-3-phosphate dehydrogenase